MDITQYFNFYDIFVNELFGDVWLFAIVGIILVWFICIRCRLPYHVPLLFTIIFFGMVYSQNPATLLLFWIIALMLTGFIFYYMISRMLNRG